MASQIKLIPALFICFMISITNTLAQDIKLEKHQKFYINHLSKQYVVDNNKIIDITETQESEYQNQFLGNINHVDINNPLRLLLFFGESNTIVYLNQELSQIGESVLLDEIGSIEVKAICSSVTNGFWIFNGFSKRLEYYNEKLKLTHSSEILNELNPLENESFELQMLGDRLYLNTFSQGIMVFDVYGTYIKTLPILKAQSFQIISSGILYTQSHQILQYQFESLKNKLILDANTAIAYARFFNDRIYYIDNQEVKIMNIKKVAP